VSLFETAEYETVVEIPRSADARRTVRNQAMIDRGIHPVTHYPLAPAGTCGECRFLDGHARNRTWYKCGLDAPRFFSSGPATDIRLKWPACNRFEKRVEL
jgi:hypothetical protein